MTATMKQAERIAEAIFDRIEKDRTLIKTNVVTEIYNGLLLANAIVADSKKQAPDIDQNDVIIREAIRLVNVCFRDINTWASLPPDLRSAADALYNVLRRADHI